MPTRAATLARLAGKPTGEQGRLVLENYQTQPPPVKRHQLGDRVAAHGRPGQQATQTRKLRTNDAHHPVIITTLSLAGTNRQSHHHAACRSKAPRSPSRVSLNRRRLDAAL